MTNEITGTKARSANQIRVDEQKAESAAAAAAEGPKEVRDPNGVVMPASEAPESPKDTATRFRDPQPLPDETGSQYTARVRALRTGVEHAQMQPTDPRPLSGVRVAQDPLGISTGRVEQTQIEADSPVPATEPGVRSDAAETARVEEAADEAVTETDDEAEAPKKGKLPEGFPGRAALEANDITTYSQVRKAAAKEQLTELNGIGESTAERIKAEME